MTPFETNCTVEPSLALASGRHPPATANHCALTRCLDDTGAVFVEFLLAFMPVYVFFLCVIQLGLLFAVRLGVEHAAANAARAAAVVIGDDPKRYAGEAAHSLQIGTGRRYRAVFDAALLSLSPWVLNGTLDQLELGLPEESARQGVAARRDRVQLRPMHGASVDKVRVNVQARAVCLIGLADRIVCSAAKGRSGLPSRTVRAEAVFPYQGANYEYSK
ncbi:MAG TPA: TadE/TadG family type IV pilus assembly protein [Polyangiaceae bacterium]|nr:TadE/TadG family type IV pilus assembly protein [Polyangiaceae bacterium]